MRYVNESYHRMVIAFATLHAGLIREYLAESENYALYNRLLDAKHKAVANLERPDGYSFGSLLTDAIDYMRMFRHENRG